MSDTVKTWIEERRRIREHEPTMFERADTEVAYPRALNALQAVLGLHRRAVDIFEPSEFCAACSTDQRTVEWPCATVQAIEGAIND